MFSIAMGDDFHLQWNHAIQILPNDFQVSLMTEEEEALQATSKKNFGSAWDRRGKLTNGTWKQSMNQGQQHGKTDVEGVHDSEYRVSSTCSSKFPPICNLWWHFQFGWTRTNQEVFTCLRGFTCFSRLTGMAPAQANDTHFCMAQERGSRCCFGFFSPFGVRRRPY